MATADCTVGGHRVPEGTLVWKINEKNEVKTHVN